MIKTDNLTYIYQNEDLDSGAIQTSVVLDNINLHIKEGSFVAILGHNGSGKSTLAKHFNGILTPVSGDVYVLSMNTKEEENILKIRKNAGMVFQNPDNQMVAAIVEDDVAFAPENLGVDPKEIRRRVDKALEAVGMSEFSNAPASKLSGGQKQRVAIAGVLAMKPKCIILDEPTAMLDPKGRAEVISTIEELNRENNITVILITHYMEEAARADRIIVMNDGVIAKDGTPKEVFKNVEMLKDIGLDVPQATELCYLLRQGGVDLPDDIISASECVEAISLYLKKSAENNL